MPANILGCAHRLLLRQCRPDHELVPGVWTFRADITKWGLPKMGMESTERRKNVQQAALIMGLRCAAR